MGDLQILLIIFQIVGLRAASLPATNNGYRHWKARAKPVSRTVVAPIGAAISAAVSAAVSATTTSTTTATSAVEARAATAAVGSAATAAVEATAATAAVGTTATAFSRVGRGRERGRKNNDGNPNLECRHDFPSRFRALTARMRDMIMAGKAQLH
jgi:cobalamin biosynthesis Mg chelatase CobN